MRLKDFIPSPLRKLSCCSKQSQRTYGSYAEAQAGCDSGYEETDLVEVVYEKTRVYRDRLMQQKPFVAEAGDLRTLFGLSLPARGNVLHVIDFGGACGAHYFMARQAWGDRLKLQWHVVETPAMAAKGTALEDGQLKFFSDIQQARSDWDHVDLVFSSGALQYVPHPYQSLQLLLECDAQHLFLTRLGLTISGKEQIVLQESNLVANGPGPALPGMQDRVVRYPVTFSRKEVMEGMLSKRYAIDVLFEEDKAAYRAAGEAIDTFGYFATRKSH